VGTISGFVGEMFKGSLTAVQIWARAVNDRGGVVGHPVEVRVVDDGGDPARHKAGIQQLVEKDGVLAIVGDNGFLALREDSVRYVEQKGVPIVGGDALNDLWFNSPMMFPQMAAGNYKLWSQMVAAADTAGPGGKFGYILCTEGPICQDALKWWPEYAKRNGLQVVYGSQMSMTQPNFTAECIAARNAGVQFLMLGMDTNSERRVIASCAQQGFNPVFGLVQVRAEMAADKGIDGAVVVSNVFPWVEADTAATREFHDVMAKYAPNLGIAYDVSQGWVTGKLFEKAAANLGDNPTSADVLKGLWAMKGETVGGLTAPLSFTQGQPPAPVTCYWPVRAQGGRWTAPLGAQGVCKPRA
jgi:branched-chain amino acid transport system substrate-binding protein